MQNRKFNSGPIALTTSPANLVAAPTLTGGVNFGGATACYLIVEHITIVNTTGSAATFTMYVGATGGSAAGTQTIGVATSVAANSRHEWSGRMALSSAQFLTGLASAASNTLIVTITGEIGVA